MPTPTQTPTQTQTQTQNPLLQGNSFLEREAEILQKYQEQAELEVIKELQDALESLYLLAQLKQYANSHGLRFVALSKRINSLKQRQQL